MISRYRLIFGREEPLLCRMYTRNDSTNINRSCRLGGVCNFHDKFLFRGDVFEICNLASVDFNVKGFLCGSVTSRIAPPRLILTCDDPDLTNVFVHWTDGEVIMLIIISTLKV